MPVIKSVKQDVPANPLSRQDQQQNFDSPYLSVREVADYLKINTKKVYALVNEGKIPATKVTGKWLFPRKLVDHWIMESSHGGLLTDRLVVTGNQDALIQRAITTLVNELKGGALVSYTHTGTELGLSLLTRNRADITGVSWGPAAGSERRHAALIQNYPPYKSWVLVRLFERQHGLILSPEFGLPIDLKEVFNNDVRWAMSVQELNNSSPLSDLSHEQGIDAAQIHITHRTIAQHEAVSLLARGEADVTMGTQANATQFGMEFINLRWDAYDFALNRGIYFRNLFQKLMEEIQSLECQRLAKTLGGYNFADCGKIIWSD